MCLIVGSARDLWHGEEHWITQEVYSGQGSTNAGGPDPSGYSYT